MESQELENSICFTNLVGFRKEKYINNFHWETRSNEEAKGYPTSIKNIRITTYLWLSALCYLYLRDADSLIFSQVSAWVLSFRFDSINFRHQARGKIADLCERESGERGSDHSFQSRENLFSYAAFFI